MYKKIARIGPISCGIFYALMSLLFYAVMLGAGYLTAGAVGLNGANAPISIVMSRFEIFTQGSVDPTKIFPIDLAYGVGVTLVAGFVIGLLVAILYNIIAMITGGIKIKTHDLGYDDL